METLGFLVGKGLTTFRLSPKKWTRATTVADVGTNAHGLTHLLLCGAEVLHDDDFEEDYVEVADIAKGRLMIELRAARRGVSDDHERQSLFNVLTSSMRSGLVDLEEDLEELLTPGGVDHASEQRPNVMKKGLSQAEFLKQRRASKAAAEDALSQQKAAPQPSEDTPAARARAWASRAS